jgi:hypothetical protein
MEVLLQSLAEKLVLEFARQETSVKELNGRMRLVLKAFSLAPRDSLFQSDL